MIFYNRKPVSRVYSKEFWPVKKVVYDNVVVYMESRATDFATFLDGPSFNSLFKETFTENYYVSFKHKNIGNYNSESKEWEITVPEGAVNFAVDGSIPIYLWAETDENSTVPSIRWGSADPVHKWELEEGRVLLNSNCKNMFTSMQFVGDFSLEDIDGAFIQDATGMFQGTSIDGTFKCYDNLKLFGCKSISGMFEFATIGSFQKSNESAPNNVFTPEFHTEYVSDFSRAFRGLYTTRMTSSESAVLDASDLSFKNATNVDSAFAGPHNVGSAYYLAFKEIRGLNNKDFSKVNNIDGLLSAVGDPTYAETIDLSNSIFSSVTSLHLVLNGPNLKSVNLSGAKFNSVAVDNTTNYLIDIRGATTDSITVDLSKANFQSLLGSSIVSSNVGVDLNLSECNMASLKAMRIGNNVRTVNFDKIKLNSFRFWAYSGSPIFNQYLENIDLSTAEVSESNDVKLDCLFYGCSNLKTYNIDCLRGKAITSMKSMFQNCSSLKEVDLSIFKFSRYFSDSISAFRDCTSLTTVYTSPVNVFKTPTSSNYMFTGCTALVGGKGTVYDENHVDAEYARIDDPDNGKPGYFTEKIA